ncbi:MAG: hypothetical protein WAO10_22040 [Candidatus Sulfotelmatobacter sp.]
MPEHVWFFKLQGDAHLALLRTGSDSRKLLKIRDLLGVPWAVEMEQQMLIVTMLVKQINTMDFVA